MFRDCYFEYAGISSQPYGLIMCYIGNSNEDFDSGGKFELKTDTLPRSHETFLYGKDYSAEPLKFDIEIVNHENYIPLEQMIEIKNWLFGQDGWKKLKLMDDRQDYHLKCIFQPGEDIVDGLGYRGVRCTLINVSPFWYGDERIINLTQSDIISSSITLNSYWWSSFEIDVPETDGVAGDILPNITIDIDKGNYQTNVNKFILSTVNAESAADAIAKHTIQVDGNDVEVWDKDEISNITFDITYVGTQGDPDSYDSIEVNSKYLLINSERHPDTIIYPEIDTNKPLPSLRIKQGKNIFRIRYGLYYPSIKIRYTPVYRLGAF